jgi:hypothetical protein
MIGVLEMIGSAGVAAGNDPFSAVPGSCNAIAVVHMRSLVNSPLVSAANGSTKRVPPMPKGSFPARRG